MTEIQEKAIAAIEEQQSKEDKHSTVFVCGEQLKWICREEPASAALILEDLATKTIEKAEKEIRAFAGKQKRSGNAVAISMSEADVILREFYGLADAAAEQEPEPEAPKTGGFVDLFDFL